MQAPKCSLALLLVLGLCHVCLTMPSVRVKRQDDLLTLDASEDKGSDLNPLNAEDVSIEDLERNKRKLPQDKLEAKNAVLGFVFGRSSPNINYRQRRGTTEDLPEFDRKEVSLEVPSELLNKSLGTLNKITKTVSSLMMNSARRYARFVLFFKPIFGDALVVRGWEDTTTTTTTTRRPTDTSNEI